jgi:hypothetical protein
LKPSKSLKSSCTPWKVWSIPMKDQMVHITLASVATWNVCTPASLWHSPCLRQVLHKSLHYLYRSGVWINLCQACLTPISC